MVKFGPVTVFEKITTWIREAVEGSKKGHDGT
jgi:hypothetical protein